MTMTIEVPPVADDESNDFKAWMKAMGFNAKQVSNAGEAIGMSPSLAGHTSRGLRELTITERLAMTAYSTNLPPWSRDKAAYIDSINAIMTLLDQEIMWGGTDTGREAEAVRTIKALIRSEASRIASERSAPQGEEQEADRAILALLRSAVQDTSGH